MAVQGERSVAEAKWGPGLVLEIRIGVLISGSKEEQ
jgi:hypothetical protein